MKKMLVPIDLSKPQKKVNDFVYPQVHGNDVVFAGIKQNKEWKNAMVVYTGVDVSASDVYEKILATGKTPGSKMEVMNLLVRYMEQLREFTVGNVLEIQRDDVDEFRLVKVVNRPNLMGSSNIP